ncbi:hypothetical protein [Anaerovirgula multivorans]|uniref:hypothetical protein n=1 Tax=Anaerovirgula multivorans TaxID=312168 RepID=UPI001A9A44B5|nr:hypothetical protein [Anaerovirgula multivorans]
MREEVDGLTAQIRKLETKSQTLVEMRLEEKIAKEDYDKKYSAIEAELKDLRDQRNEKYEALQGEKSISTRINYFRKAFDHEIQMDEFDRDILESLVDKVVVGAMDEEGNPNPYALTFVFKAGVKFTKEFYEKIANKSDKMEIENLSTYATDDKQLAYTYAPNKAGGGWGMRMLSANGAGAIENNTAYDHEYRVNTDVITSVRIYASDDITPDNRHVSEAAYNNPVKNTATVTISTNGYSKSTEIVMPSGSSQLVWLKWRTPSTSQDVTVHVSVTGNSAARIDGTSRNATLTCRVVDLGLNPPPNPTVIDRNDGFRVPNLPVKAEKTSAHWGIYSSTWIPKWVWHPKWEWESDWDWVSTEDGGYWEDNGSWVDNGKWKDEGSWQFDYTSYTASLTGQMRLTPDSKVPTAQNSTMKSGYGVNINISTTPHTNAPSSHVTSAQNAISYFPEFAYETYWRKLQLMGYGQFQFEENKYSTYRNRVHFTPIWYPDETYRVYTEIIDMWTPDGMLRINLNDDVTIRGDLYQDWHIGPK